MEPDQSSSAPRKLKFAPKAPPRRRLKPTAPKTEAGDEDGEAEQVQQLLRRINENHGRRRPKDEKKSSIQVAFGPGDKASTQIKRYGSAKDGSGGKSSDSDTKSSDYGQTLLSLPSAANENVREACFEDSTSKSAQLVKKDYREPWDYHNTYYPSTLPLRMPSSGDPEILDEAEFGEAAANTEYDENTINPASDLGLMVESEEEKMFFFKLPASLPFLKRSTSRKGKEKVETHTSSDGGGVSNKGCRLEELPDGYMGKMLVYKSGAIKLKLGDALYDVSPGSDCIFAQDVAAINLAERQCCVLGELGKRAVVSPDVDSLLDSVIDLG
ncbi:DNA-directed RNA polymerase III subunit rpc4-like [Alnus glutinosa]|uniref:DNA-directed RNA polymerase III subunit rpc4-like n=1 Tax=Alnus glutinosa TaxID=3517 RepID=UPI002D78F9BF|nr:DNA-directed RNA polymerase III subunit rpc4-like [Alnus glutinosa]